MAKDNQETPRPKLQLVPSVTTLPPPEPDYTVRDAVLEVLEQLLADIKSGKRDPVHLIIGLGERIEIDGEPASSYWWDAVGLDRFEVIGQVSTYAAKLAIGEGQ